MYACAYCCHSLCKIDPGSIAFATRDAGTVPLCDTNVGQERMRILESVKCSRSSQSSTCLTELCCECLREECRFQVNFAILRTRLIMTELKAKNNDKFVEKL